MCVNIACKYCIFHLINSSQNVGTLWLEFAFLHFFHGPCAKQNHKYQYQDIRNLNDCSIHTYIIKHYNNTPLMENLNPKCNKNKYKKYQILNLQNE